MYHSAWNGFLAIARLSSLDIVYFFHTGLLNYTVYICYVR